MWAYTIYNEEEDSLFCSRDRYGIRPFNYSLNNGQFLFASESKAILKYDKSYRKPNYNSIANYCRESIGAQSEESWFKNIYRLKPAHNLKINREGKKEYKRYWDYPTKCNYNITEEEAVKEYKKLFFDSIKIRLPKTLKLGATLSSGIDSSSIVGIIDTIYKGNIDCYTASFPGFVNDEFPIAKSFSDTLSVNHHQIIPSYNNYVKELSKIIYHMESGHSSPAIFPLSYIYSNAKKSIDVCLDGESADTLLAGESTLLFVDLFIENISNLRIKQAFKELFIQIKRKKLFTAIIMFLRNNGNVFVKKMMRKFYGIENVYIGELLNYKPYRYNRKKSYDSRINKKQSENHQSALLNTLHYGDALPLMYSIENRFPFLDHRLVEYVFKLPASFKIKNGIGKRLHRKAVKDIVPESILNKPEALGFPSPLNELFLMSKDKKSDALKIISSERFIARKIFNQKELNKLIAIHQSGKKDYSRFLYRILSVELWFRVFIDEF
jgi:asparagine synthase (glutamine-hydrolysing)